MRIRVNLKKYKVYKVLFEDNKMLLETNINFNKMLSGNIFNFNIFPILRDKHFTIKSSIKDNNNPTIYFRIPKKIRDTDIFDKKIVCSKTDNIFVFQINRNF